MTVSTRDVWPCVRCEVKMIERSQQFWQKVIRYATFDTFESHWRSEGATVCKYQLWGW